MEIPITSKLFNKNVINILQHSDKTIQLIRKEIMTDKQITIK